MSRIFACLLSMLMSAMLFAQSGNQQGIDIDFSNPIVEGSCQGASGTMQFSGSGFEIGFNNGNATLCPEVLRLGNGNASVEFLAGIHDVVTISFDLWIGKLVNHEVEFGVLDVESKRIGGAKIIKWTDKGLLGYSDFGDIQGAFIDGPQYAVENDNICSNDHKNTVTLTFDFVRNSLKAHIDNGKGGSFETQETTMRSTQQMKSFFIRTNYDNSNRRCWFDNLKISSTTSSNINRMADYTIRRLCGSTQIADDIVAHDIAGSKVVLRESDRPAQIAYNGDVYYYVDDDAASHSINADGSTIVTVRYRLENTYSYTFKAVNAEGTVLQDFGQGTYKESAPIRAFYPRAILHGGTYYGIARNGYDPYYGIQLREGDNRLTYTPLDPQPTYYAEIENMNLHLETPKNGNSWMGNPSAPQRYSEGKAYRLNYGQYVSTPALSAGLYRIVLYARNPKTADYRGIGVRVGNEAGSITFPAIEFNAWVNSECGEHTIADLMVPEGYSLQVVELNNTNNELELDYVMVYRTGNVKTLASSANLRGWKNFFDATESWQVDANTSIYRVEKGAEENSYNVVRNDETKIVPAGNAVLLRTTNDVDNLIVMKQADGNGIDLGSNELKASTTELTGLDVSTHYRFGYVNGIGIGFFTVSKVPANTPYLETSSTAPSFHYWEEDETQTAIQSISADAEAAVPCYNLQGQPSLRRTGLVITHDGLHLYR